MNEHIINEFLDEARRGDKEILIYTINGFPMKGKLSGYDSQCIRLKSGEESYLVMYSAISTIKIAPEKIQAKAHVYEDTPGTVDKNDQ